MEDGLEDERHSNHSKQSKYSRRSHRSDRSHHHHSHAPYDSENYQARDDGSQDGIKVIDVEPGHHVIDADPIIIDVPDPSPSPESLRLLQAVRDRDKDAVQQLLEEGANLSTRDPDGWTALHRAVGDDDKSMIRLLCERGADTEAADSDGVKPLYLAVTSKLAKTHDLSVVQLLLKLKANVESRNEITLKTAFYQAIEDGNVGLAELLLDNRADIDSSLLNGQTALFSAVHSGKLDAVNFLLSHGANKRLRLEDGQTVDDFASGDNAMIDLLRSSQLLEGPSITNPSMGAERRFMYTPYLPADNIDKEYSCRGFEATIIDFFGGERERRIQVSTTVYDLLYGRGPEAIMGSARGTKLSGQKALFRWYHLPANNMEWIQLLANRITAEHPSGGGILDEDTKSKLALTNSPSRQYRAATAQSSFMRPLSQIIKPRNLHLSTTDLSSASDHLMLFVPFLHFETYRGYQSMNVVIANVKNRLKPPPPAPPPSTGMPKMSGSKPPLPPSFWPSGPPGRPSKKHSSLPVIESSDESDSGSTESPAYKGNSAFRKFMQTTHRLQSALKDIGSKARVKSHQVAKSVGFTLPSTEDLEKGSPVEEQLSVGDNAPEPSDKPRQADSLKLKNPETNPADPKQAPNKSDTITVVSTTLPVVGNTEGIAEPAGAETLHTKAVLSQSNAPTNDTALPQGGTVPKSKASTKDNSEGPDSQPISAKDSNNNPVPDGSGQVKRSDDTGSNAGEMVPPKSFPDPAPLQSTALHQTFQTDAERKLPKIRRSRHKRPMGPLDEHLIKGYLWPNRIGEIPPLQLRRTLDQYYYTHLTTSERDSDQVILRYTQQYNLEPKIFMVDQLWLWILNDDTVISCFPERWEETGAPSIPSFVPVPGTSSKHQVPPSVSLPNDFNPYYGPPPPPGNISQWPGAPTQVVLTGSHKYSRSGQRIKVPPPGTFKPPPGTTVPTTGSNSQPFIPPAPVLTDLQAVNTKAFGLPPPPAVRTQNDQYSLAKDQSRAPKVGGEPPFSTFIQQDDTVDFTLPLTGTHTGKKKKPSGVLDWMTGKKTRLSSNTGHSGKLDAKVPHVRHSFDSIYDASDDGKFIAWDPSSRMKKRRQEFLQNDPLNVHQMIMKYLQGSARAPITSAHELANIITDSCVNVFDQSQIPAEYQFFEFFEQSIGSVMDKEASCSRQFAVTLNNFQKESNPIGQTDALYSINNETQLLIEIKDIREELFILQMVLTDQLEVLRKFSASLQSRRGEISENSARTSAAIRFEIIESHLHRVEKMEKLAETTYKSLNHLLDLKQKQANVSEALITRKQAEITFKQAEKAAQHAEKGMDMNELAYQQSLEAARQGRTVMLFTVITIIFLPLSFLAAFFAINLDSFPANEDGQLPTGYVVRYLFSISAAVSIPFIFVAFNQDRIAAWITAYGRASRPVWIIVVIAVTILLSVIWTRKLASGMKAAVTAATLLLVALGAIFYWVYIQISSIRHGSSSSGSSSSEEMIDD